jgi:hypothetical protein
MNTATTITREQVLAVFKAPPQRTGHGELGAVPPFPIHVLPSDLSDMARELYRCNRAPIDYTGTGILFAVSVAIGNTLHVRVKEGYTMPPILWLALVGRPGTNKTSPLRSALAPLRAMDKLRFMEYRSARADHTRSKVDGSDGGPQPTRKLHLFTDATMERLLPVLQANPRGVGLYREELSGWWGSMDAYRKGGDRERWLSMHSGEPVDALRKTSEDVLVDSPFVSVCGTTQPSKLGTLGRDSDGFLPRILFAYPDEQSKAYMIEAEADPEWSTYWGQVVGRMLEIPMASEEGPPHFVGFTAEARAKYMAWQHRSTDLTNATDVDALAELYPKLETYLPRLALVLEVLHTVTEGNGEIGMIGERAMDGAIELVEYFAATARKVHFQLFEADAVDRLPGMKARIYSALPDKFTTGDGGKVAEAMGMAKRSWTRWLRDTKLFRKLGHGEYLKLLEA